MTTTRPSEHDEQAALMQRCQWYANQYPELRLLFAVPNGGLRAKATAGRLRAEGVRPGVPDLCLPVARNGRHGLFVELKTKGGRPTPEQMQWIAALTEQGYHAVVCYGQDAAWDAIAGYLGITDDAQRRAA